MPANVGVMLTIHKNILVILFSRLPRLTDLKGI